MSEFVLRGGKLGRAPETRILEFKDAMHPTEGDLLGAGMSQRTRILQRTANHVDVDGAPFAPYADNGPYYYRPWDRPGLGGKGKSLEVRRAALHFKKREDATERFFRRIGGDVRTGELKVKGDLLASLHKSGDTIKFESYAAFKRSLGRSGIDLIGPRAPHMMQAIEVKAASNELTLGIYGEKAAIATAHNTGTGKLPRRRFFGASNDDAKKMLAEIFAHMKARLGFGS